MKHTISERRRFSSYLQGFLFLVPFYSILWMVLTGGRKDSWLLGVPAILVAAFFSGRFQGARSGRYSLLGAFRFAGFFLKASLFSGFDVVRRAIMPRILLSPDLIDYRLSLSTDAARIFMADAVSLLPGTLSAGLDQDKLTVHVLDRNMPIQAELRALEKRVAAMLEATDRPHSNNEGALQ